MPAIFHKLYFMLQQCKILMVVIVVGINSTFFSVPPPQIQMFKVTLSVFKDLEIIISQLTYLRLFHIIEHSA
jgi:hypothetical protein